MNCCINRELSPFGVRVNKAALEQCKTESGIQTAFAFSSESLDFSSRSVVLGMGEGVDLARGAAEGKG